VLATGNYTGTNGGEVAALHYLAAYDQSGIAAQFIEVERELARQRKANNLAP